MGHVKFRGELVLDFSQRQEGMTFRARHIEGDHPEFLGHIFIALKCLNCGCLHRRVKAKQGILSASSK